MRHRTTVHRRALRLATAVAVAALGAPVASITTAAPANAWDPAVDCALATEGCFVDRYQDPTVDFGDLDAGSTLGIPNPDQAGADSTRYPFRRNATNGVGVTFRGLTNFPYTASGTDISMLDPALNGGKLYVPCKNRAETYKGLCMSPTEPSYHQGRAFSGGSSSNAYPSGYLVPNTATTSNCNNCVSYWGNKLFGADFEFYPRVADGSAQTNANYVRPRLSVRGPNTTVNVFPSTASGNGWNMTADYGSIPARYITMANVGRIRGYTYSAPNVAAAPGRLVFSMFQRNNVSHATTSTGKYLGSFFSGRNGSGGYWNSGAVYAASFDLTVRDSQTGQVCRAVNQSVLTGLRQDFKLYEENMGKVANNWSCWYE